MLTARGARTEALLDWLGGEMSDADPTERLLALVRDVESMYVPSPIRVEEIHDHLDHDLKRFGKRYGIDLWSPA